MYKDFVFAAQHQAALGCYWQLSLAQNAMARTGVGEP